MYVKTFLAITGSALAARWGCVNCVTVCLYESRLWLRLEQGAIMELIAECAWREAQIDHRWNFGHMWCDRWELIWISRVRLCWPTGSFPHVQVWFLECVHVGFVCEGSYFWRRQLNFLFQCVIIRGMKAWVLFLVPHTRQHYNIQSEDTLICLKDHLLSQTMKSVSQNKCF